MKPFRPDTAFMAISVIPLLLMAPTLADDFAAGDWAARDWAKSTPAPVSMSFEKGDYVPVEFGEANWPEYRAFNLPPAPDGFDWVRVEDQALLINAATGQVESAYDNLDARQSTS